MGALGDPTAVVDPTLKLVLLHFHEIIKILQMLKTSRIDDNIK